MRLGQREEKTVCLERSTAYNNQNDCDLTTYLPEEGINPALAWWPTGPHPDLEGTIQTVHSVEIDKIKLNRHLQLG